MRASTAHGSAGWRTVLAWLSVRVGSCEWVTVESMRVRETETRERKTERQRGYR